MTSSLHHNLIGKRVGAGRWPYSAAHPDGWGTPHQGTVLALDNPRAWTGTIAFPIGVPDQDAVTRHVDWCRDQGLLGTEMPVLWDFPEGPTVRWEQVSSLVSVEDDLAAWNKARAKAYGRDAA